MRFVKFNAIVLSACALCGCASSGDNFNRLAGIKTVAVLETPNPGKYEVVTAYERQVAGVGLAVGVLTAGVGLAALSASATVLGGRAFSSDAALGVTGEDALDQKDIRLSDYLIDGLLAGFREEGLTAERLDARPFAGGNPQMRYNLAGIRTDAVADVALVHAGYYENAPKEEGGRTEYVPWVEVRIQFAVPRNGRMILARNYACGVFDPMANVEAVGVNTRFGLHPEPEDAEDPSAVIARNSNLAAEGIRACVDGILGRFFAQIKGPATD